MSKATIRAKERYWLEPSNIETQEKYAAYVEGYNQAEKDNELTWEDLKTLDDISDTVYAEYDVVMFDEEEYYQEILKRFQDLKK